MSAQEKDNAMKNNAMELSRVIFFVGRTWGEYLRMFDLSERDLRGLAVLDCPAGACSFTAQGNRRGLNVTACDLAYHFFSIDQLADKGLEDIELAVAGVEKADDCFLWDEIRSPEELRQLRSRALSEWTQDRLLHKEAYVPAVLPELPFSSRQFDMTLSAHFLFTYADRLDYAFHQQTIQELVRVTAREIRIFPTADLSGKRYGQMDRLLAWIGTLGWTAEEIRVPYLFQKKGANTMLKLHVEHC